MQKNEFLNHLEPINQYLFGFAFRLTKEFSKAEDLVQETIFKAFLKRKLFKPNTNFKSWISAIMHNTFINQYQKQRRKRLLQAKMEDSAYRIKQQSYSQNYVEQLIHYKEIHQVIDGIDSNYKDPLKLYAEGFKYKEISKLLDLPIGTVKSRINSARKLLKNELTKIYGDNPIF